MNGGDTTEQLPLWLAFLDNTYWPVTVPTFVFQALTRSVGVAYFITGCTLCSIGVKLVKNSIKQPRPVVIDRRSKKPRKSYGMPSTHSAVIIFYLVYIVLACQRLPLHPTLPQSPWTRTIPMVVCIPWGIMICLSRVWLGHHTWAQVIAGCTFGAICAVLWFALWVNGLNEYGKAVEHFLAPILLLPSS